MGQAIAPRTLGRDARCDSGTYAPRRLVRGHLPDSLTFRSPTVFHSRTNSGRLTGRQAAESVKVGRKRGSMMVVRSSVSRNTWFVEGLRQKRATFGSIRRVQKAVPEAARLRVGRRTRGENSSERRERRDAVHRRQPRSSGRLRTTGWRPSTFA